jgi:hypothetical protein
MRVRLKVNGREQAYKVGGVVDALRPLGVRDIPMPLKRERIWALLHPQH